MAYTKTAELDNVRGAWIELGTFTLDPASIAANAQGIETVTIAGLAVGDQCFINPQAMATSMVCVGCKVTGTDELSVYLNNTIDATTAVNGGSLTYDIIIVHNS